MKAARRKHRAADIDTKLANGLGRFDGVETNGQARFFAAGVGGVDDAVFGGFVEGGGEAAQGGCGVRFLPGGHEGGVVFLQSVQARFDGMIAQLFARAVAHAPFG
jgi:hypothetical protein